MRIAGIILMLIGLFVSGCDGTASSPTPVQFVQPVECLEIPAQTCQEIVNDARRNAQPGVFVVHIRAVCTRVPSCTRADGEVTIDAQYSDGHSENTGMGWSAAADPAQPPPAEPPQPDGSEQAPAPLPVEPVCVGVPPGRCHDQAENGIDPAKEFDHDPGDVVGIVVRCTVAMCTDEGGSGDTIVTYRDGTTSKGGWSYAGASAS